MVQVQLYMVIVVHCGVKIKLEVDTSAAMSLILEQKGEHVNSLVRLISKNRKGKSQREKVQHE